MANLPTHPPKGQRQALDQQWLAKLHREGLGELPVGVPKGPAALKLAVAQFNQGEYWQCHETLEDIWILEEYPLRLFYHGLIKAAVGLLHLERPQPLGCEFKTERGRVYSRSVLSQHTGNRQLPSYWMTSNSGLSLLTVTSVQPRMPSTRFHRSKYTIYDERTVSDPCYEGWACRPVRLFPGTTSGR